MYLISALTPFIILSHTSKGSGFTPYSNLIAEHIMMDAKSLVPTGWHFVAPFCEPDGMTRITPLDRKRYHVRYYFIGFGNCLHIPSHQRTTIKGIGGGDYDVPELITGEAYDPFKLDIYTLGNVIDNYLYEVRILFI